jgi:hypothetical protein
MRRSETPRLFRAPRLKVGAHLEKSRFVWRLIGLECLRLLKVLRIDDELMTGLSSVCAPLKSNPENRAGKNTYATRVVIQGKYGFR